MENTYLAKILPFLNEIEKSRREQFEQYFRTAPMWLMETFAVEELEEGTVFVPCRYDLFHWQRAD